MANQEQTTKNPPGKVLRFTGGERFSHWTHAISFFLLLITGLAILFVPIRPLFDVFGGMDVARNIHRVVAVIFVVVVLAMFFIGNPKHHREWLRSSFRFTKADIAHVKAFAKEFFGGHGDYPPQAKYNGGEKINSLITILGTVLITLSGIVKWFPLFFPNVIVQLASPIHTGAMFLMTIALIGHMYLSLLHPESRVALPGMLNGYVREEFAKSHHAEWYNEIRGQQKAE